MKKNNLLILLFAYFVCMIFFSQGCGYSATSLLPAGMKSIHVDNFINKIDLTMQPTDKRMYVAYRSGMELDITRDTINRFILDGNLKVLPKGQADLILKGLLIDFKKEALRYDSNETIIEFRLKVTVDIELYKRSNNELLWRERNFTGEAFYRLTGEFAITEDNAIQNAIEDLAIRIVERTTEDW